MSEKTKHTWDDLAVAAGATRETAGLFLWAGSAFPFAKPRTVYYQVQHCVRHGKCLDDPEANCSGRRTAP